MCCSVSLCLISWRHAVCCVALICDDMTVELRVDVQSVDLLCVVVLCLRAGVVLCCCVVVCVALPAVSLISSFVTVNALRFECVDVFR